MTKKARAVKARAPKKFGFRLEASLESCDLGAFANKLTLVKFPEGTTKDALDECSQAFEDALFMDGDGPTPMDASFLFVVGDVSMETIDPEAVPPKIRKRLMDAWLGRESA